jgi:hypothetical protein
MESNKCINCEQTVENNFCSHCGQRTSVKRITFREGWNDFWARIYGFDGMFPRTLRDLTIRPGKVAQLFIDGNRAKYYGPVGYFFLMITLFLLVLSLLNIDMVKFMESISKSSFQSGYKKGLGQEEIFAQTIKFVTDNLKIITFIFIPLQAIASKYIFFRRSQYNFLEHTILPFYLQGHIYWASILSAFVFKFFGSLFLNYFIVALSLIYMPLGYVSLFSEKSKIMTFLKGLGVYISGQILFSLLVIIIVIVALIVNPEFYQLIKPSNNK